jgi:hypothetical protein
VAPPGLEPGIPKETDFKTSRTDRDDAHESLIDGVSDQGTRTMVQEGGALVQPIGQSGPREALARALELAAEAGEWETVRALAETLGRLGA